jgi:hypothetical protein
MRKTRRNRKSRMRTKRGGFLGLSNPFSSAPEAPEAPEAPTDAPSTSWFGSINPFNKKAAPAPEPLYATPVGGRRRRSRRRR